MPEDKKAGSKLHERAQEGRVVGYGPFPRVYRWRIVDTRKVLVSAHFCWAVPVTETKLPQGNICPPVQPESKDNCLWPSTLELSDNKSETQISAEISQNIEDIYPQQIEYSKSPEPRKGTRVCKQSWKARENNTTEKASFVVDTEICGLENIEKEIDKNAFLASADTSTFSDITHSPKYIQ
jgi:hypothetical protein